MPASRYGATREFLVFYSIKINLKDISFFHPINIIYGNEDIRRMF